MAELLKGAPVARALTEELAARCAALRERGVVPTLAIVRVGERETYPTSAAPLNAAKRLASRRVACCFLPVFRKTSC